MEPPRIIPVMSVQACTCFKSVLIVRIGFLLIAVNVRRKQFYVIYLVSVKWRNNNYLGKFGWPTCISKKITIWKRVGKLTLKYRIWIHKHAIQTDKRKRDQFWQKLCVFVLHFEISRRIVHTSCTRRCIFSSIER